MVKPQNKPYYEETFIKKDYPPEMDRMESFLREKVDDLAMDDVAAMVEIAYKAGYLDAWKEAMFFNDF